VVGFGHLGSVGYGPEQSGGQRGSKEPGLQKEKAACKRSRTSRQDRSRGIR
jgi:hypothetical protein